jgi:hypothetical protein
VTRRRLGYNWKLLAVICTVGAAATLGGCAALSGSADPVVASGTQVKLLKKSYTWDVVNKAFDDPSDACSDTLKWPTCRDGRTRVQYRNFVVGLYLSASEARYRQFVASLTREAKGTAFGGSIVNLILSGVSVVSGDEARRALAASSAVVSGGQAAVSRDLFIQQTLPAVISAMDAKRDEVKTRILTRLRQSAEEYPLAIALSDVAELEGQASLERAVGKLTSQAAQDAAVQKKKLEIAYEIPILGPLTARRSELLDRLEALDDATLAAALQALGASSGADRAAKVASARVWVNQNVQSEQALDLANKTIDDVLKAAEKPNA